MNQEFLGQTKAQREDDYKDNSIIIQGCEIDDGNDILAINHTIPNKMEKII
jgi:hypothetical protein